VVERLGALEAANALSASHSARHAACCAGRHGVSVGSHTRPFIHYAATSPLGPPARGPAATTTRAGRER
jgi:hypothetical protein